MGKLDLSYELQNRYLDSAPERPGRVYLTGTQALVRMVLAQAERDRAAGLDTAGFVSGYRGSPLGAVDQEMWRAKDALAVANVRLQPAINEDLGATAVMGTQKVETDPDRTVGGVFALWYGKGPGVDRSGDAIKHGNAYGSSPHGGVLVVAGDDHGCASSSMSHQSDGALIAWSMPIIHPANIADYVPFGLWGWAASRASGAWIGFKAISETVEGSASVPVAPVPPYLPAAVDLGPDGLHWRWPDLPGPQIERRLAFKLAAVTAFARVNPIDTVTVAAGASPRLLIAAVGKAHGDVMEALRVGGLTPGALAVAGVCVLKVGLVHPLSPMLADLAANAEEVLVVEEKAPVVEGLLKTHLFNATRRPRVFGKAGPCGGALLLSDTELRPSRVAPALAQRLAVVGLTLKIPGALPAEAHPAGLPVRTPYFCSGCPHNTSTKVPEGSRAQAGIGCHFMAGWMDRSTSGIVQMGGEGVDWVGQSPFVKTPHVFQNLGDGTFFHSGLLAIRQAVAAKTNITYKILFNDAVAMTGGQPVEGAMPVARITQVVRAEGAAQVVVVADDPAKYGPSPGFAAGTALHGRDELDAVQRSLRDTPGVTVLIYDQVCATEVRRRRKRAGTPKPATRVVINDLVCEGCGDCQDKSNCLSVVPVETPFGRKRAIDQGSCNTDLSCLKGFCPSFVTLEGGTLRKAGPSVSADAVLARAAALPEPDTALGGQPWEIMVAGVGGTGIVTVGALVTMAAHLCGHGATVLDFMGFAQKGGQVLSHVRLARSPETLHQVRIDCGQVDVLLAADLVVATGPEPLAAIDPARTRILASTRETQTGTTLRDPHARIDTVLLQALLRRRVADGALRTVDAPRLAERLLGDAITSNILLLGMAWQLGLVPLPFAALARAIELNGVAVDDNKLAFAWGRLAAADEGFVAKHMADDVVADDPLARRAAFLRDYQDAAYAERYRNRVAAVATLGDAALTAAVTANLFKLMAVKDEYEVARLHTGTGFLERELGRYEAAPRVTFHLAPPVLSRPGPDGTPRKRAFGPWMVLAFRALARLRGLRGTPLDLFGLTAERRRERALLTEYEAMLDALLAHWTAARAGTWRELAALPDRIRGFGHVKEGAMDDVAERRAALMTQLDVPAKPAVAA